MALRKCTFDIDNYSERGPLPLGWPPIKLSSVLNCPSGLFTFQPELHAGF